MKALRKLTRMRLCVRVRNWHVEFPCLSEVSGLRRLWQRLSWGKTWECKWLPMDYDVRARWILGCFVRDLPYWRDFNRFAEVYVDEI